ncbi:putative glutathione-specific gamma-glutamylcyclotransferase 2 isoform X2 [Oratosquilla oratoria]|uniref:putative glutathione-specific gamma-glutamylcyclotransferase 2 isoform X2 n=1 Tax=Oratosquilla oratoria TaxID=337810 RepID=UPI003F75E2BA
MTGRPDNTSLWVFGYGSLCWHPGFHFGKHCVGFIKNYVRRFWQGNTTHRGTPEQGVTWGMAYELTGEAALAYLNTREVSLGGYTTAVVPFFPKESLHGEGGGEGGGGSAGGGPLSPFPVLLYIATKSSKDWAGPAPLHEIATQIMKSKGPTGHNVEYLLRLAEFMREKVPEGYDEHLATLETFVRIRVKENNLCLKTLMGDLQGRPDEGAVAVAAGPGGRFDPAAAAIAAAGGHAAPAGAAAGAEVENHEERRDTFQYSANLPPKKLRCLNV